MKTSAVAGRGASLGARVAGALHANERAAAESKIEEALAGIGLR
jgi:hypothetical protein